MVKEVKLFSFCYLNKDGGGGGGGGGGAGTLSHYKV